MFIKLAKIIAVFIFIFVFLELVFRMISFTYIYCAGRFVNKYSAEPGLRVMFIGDSWSAGANVIIEDSYPANLVKKIKKRHPGLKLEDFNFSYMGANSSQIVCQFLENYKRTRPRILFLTVGTNNLWNKQAVFAVEKKIELIDGMNSGTTFRKNSFLPAMLDFINSLKAVKFFRIIDYNLRFSRFEQKDPIPEADTLLKRIYMSKMDDGKIDEARSYLVSHKDEIGGYNEFYKLILFSFYNDFDKTEAYLKNQGLWRKGLMGENYYKYIKRDSSFRMDYILDRDLHAIKFLCDKERIKMVLNSYPFESEWADIVNKKLKTVAEKYGIMYIDNYRYFNEEIGKEEWRRVMKNNHLNRDGYGYMSDYTLSELERIGILKSYN